jgi:hypothetical protein
MILTYFNITHNNDNFLDSNITHDINNNKPIDNNVPTQLCEIDFLDIDDQDLLSLQSSRTSPSKLRTLAKKSASKLFKSFIASVFIGPSILFSLM